MWDSIPHMRYTVPHLWYTILQLWYQSVMKYGQFTKKKIPMGILKKNSFGFLLFLWFLNFVHKNHCQNPPPQKKNLCVPHMRYTIPHLWYTKKNRIWIFKKIVWVKCSEIYFCWYTTIGIVYHIWGILSHICGILYYYCGINQWWNMVNFQKKFPMEILEEFFWILIDLIISEFWAQESLSKSPQKVLCVPHLWVKVTTYVV